MEANPAYLDREKIIQQERHRIGEELHSGAAQSLSHALFLLNLHEQEGRKEDLAAVRQAIKMAVNEIRHAIHELRNESPWPLIPSVRDCVGEFRDRLQLPVTLTIEGSDVNCPSEVRHYLLTFIQEGLGNVSKHAQASTCRVELKLSLEEAIVTIQDDGVGIPGSARDEGAPHFGLKFMTERVERMGGDLQIRSLDGQGTLLSARIPMR